MATNHAFVDESLRGDYLMCAVVVKPADVTRTRRIVRKLRRPGQRRVHMNHESDRRRREILSAISKLDVAAHVYKAQLGTPSARLARDRCLQVMAADMAQFGVSRLILEGCEQDHRDNQVIRVAAATSPTQSGFEYVHSTPAAEPLLWLPDIVAWAFGRGGDWRRRAAALLAEVKDV